MNENVIVLEEQSDMVKVFDHGEIRTKLYAVLRSLDRVRVGGITLRLTKNPYLDNFRGHTGYWIEDQFRRRGYATAALRRIIGLAQGQGLPRIVGACATGNFNSARVMELAGMQYDGIFRVPPGSYLEDKGIPFVRRFSLELDPRKNRSDADGHMNHAIELRFDDVSERRIRGLWAIAAEHYSTDYMYTNGVIPHVALLVGDSALREVFSGIQIARGEVRIGQMGFFDSGDTAYLRCELPGSLSHLQRDIYDYAMNANAKVDKRYSPQQWTPHCTIAQRCASNRGNKMDTIPFDAACGSLMLVSFTPTHLIGETHILAEQGGELDAASRRQLP